MGPADFCGKKKWKHFFLSFKQDEDKERALKKEESKDDDDNEDESSNNNADEYDPMEAEDADEYDEEGIDLIERDEFI